MYSYNPDMTAAMIELAIKLAQRDYYAKVTWSPDGWEITAEDDRTCLQVISFIRGIIAAEMNRN